MERREKLIFSLILLLSVFYFYNLSADDNVRVQVNVVKGRTENRAKMDPAIRPELAATLKGGRCNSFTLMRRDQREAAVGSSVNFDVSRDMSLEVKPLKAPSSEQPFSSINVSVYEGGAEGRRAGKRKISEITVKRLDRRKPFVQQMDENEESTYIAIYAE